MFNTLLHLCRFEPAPLRGPLASGPLAFRPAVEQLEGRLLLSADAVLDWNQVMLNANAADHALASPDQGGPTRTSRAFAIVHAAMFDALNSVTNHHTPYLVKIPGYGNADARAAVAKAGHDTLAALFPQQAASFATALAASLAEIPNGPAEARGVDLGRQVAAAILAARQNDGSELNVPYTPGTGPGQHRVDPLHPGQGFLAPGWGQVKPFAIDNVVDFRSPPPPALRSLEYTMAYYEVLMYGGDGVTTPTLRTPEQKEIGIYWGYDGAPGLGTPPRLYNQIVRVIAGNKRNTMAENARLLALVNISMADAGIQAWDTKYAYNLWRPIVGIREGGNDTNPLTVGAATWAPLGAPCTNCGGALPLNFTPPFPAYTSGHATFGAATFRTVAAFYGTDRIAFDFMSDEYNGVNRDQSGNVRPVKVRHFDRLSQAAEENGQSRIYLGIHWAFDKTRGIAAGNRIADYVADKLFRPVGRGSGNGNALATLPGLLQVTLGLTGTGKPGTTATTVSAVPAKATSDAGSFLVTGPAPNATSGPETALLRLAGRAAGTVPLGQAFDTTLPNGGEVLNTTPLGG